LRELIEAKMAHVRGRKRKAQAAAEPTTPAARRRKRAAALLLKELDRIIEHDRYPL
jgi:hypothetical protein